MTRYLADTTIWAWARRSNDLAERLATRVEEGAVATCVPVALELLHSSRSQLDYERDWRRLLGPLTWIVLDDNASLRALSLQRELAGASHGAHRLPSIDYLIAACAIRSGEETVLWHADRDLARVCDYAGHPQEHEAIRRS